MRLAFFSNPQYAMSVRRVLDKFKNQLNVIYIFECVEGAEDFIHYYQFKREKDYHYDFLKDCDVDVALVYGWNYKIPVQRYKDISFYNVHPSLLPLYRGPDPITFQILNKERRSGVTLHKMDEDFDTGPIYSQKEFSLDYDAELSRIFLRFSCCTSQLLNSFLTDLLDSNIILSSQSAASSYFSYRDLDRFIIKNDICYSEFCRIWRVLHGKYPVRILYNDSLYSLSSYSLEEDENSVVYSLQDKIIYVKFLETEVKLSNGNYNY